MKARDLKINFLSLLNIVLLLFVFSCPSRAEEESASTKSYIYDLQEPSVLKGHISKVPSGTKLKIIFQTPIDEITSMVDDEITARLSEEIIIDGTVAVPAGSTVLGKISEINLAKRWHKSGNVRIEFKSLTTPDGRQIPIVASVLSHSGLLKGKYTPRTALVSTATVVGPAVAGLGAGLAVDGSALGAAAGAALGTVAGLALFAFERGNKVDIKAGQEIGIELNEEALVPGITASGSETEELINKAGLNKIESSDNLNPDGIPADQNSPFP